MFNNRIRNKVSFQHSKLHTSTGSAKETAELQNCKTAELYTSTGSAKETAKLQNCKTAKLQNFILRQAQHRKLQYSHFSLEGYP
jgi:hypothetical protein